ncbi:MAG: HAD-IA family hydrolase [Chloroflexi bacterium]|nr:HAD-IA family hydrolase [Chloroflexota bacterium]
MHSSDKLQAIIFDLDGLMVDSEPLAQWAWDQVLNRYGHKLDHQTFRDVLGMRVADSARVICQRYDLPISPEQAFTERDQVFLDAVPTRLKACAGLYPLMDELTARGLPVGLGTSGHRRYVSLALQTLGLEDRFRAIATGDEVSRGKPAPDIFLLAAERLGIPPANCLALEDSLLGAQSVLAAGMTCVVVPDQWITSGEFPSDCHVFPSLNEVREALDDLLAEVGINRYTAAGGVVVHDGRVLVLRRSGRGEVRLPKGHVDPGKDVQTTALRETHEESGYANLAIQADLGAQMTEFDHAGQHVIRTERYFLMALTGDADSAPSGGEEQFEPDWLTWDEALAALTFEVEREWVRRARRIANDY